MQFTEEQIEGACIAYRLAHPDCRIWPLEAISDAAQCAIRTGLSPWEFKTVEELESNAPMFARYWNDDSLSEYGTLYAICDIIRMLNDTL